MWRLSEACGEAVWRVWRGCPEGVERMSERVVRLHGDVRRLSEGIGRCVEAVW